jgi:galactokinase
MTQTDPIVQKAEDIFRTRFPQYKESSLLFGRSPGRIEIIGNHTDYNEGYIMSAAIDKATVFVGTLTETAEVVMYSDHLDSTVSFALGDTFRYPDESEESWSNYPKGVIVELSPPSGFCGVFVSNVPVGAGVSSSTALDIAIAMFLKVSFPQSRAGTLEPIELALSCKKACNEFVGIGCGILDQFTLIMGKPGKLLFLDCRDIHNYEYVDLPDQFKFVVVMSDAPHQIVDGKYNQLRSECFHAAKLFGKEFLRDVSSKQFMEESIKLPENERKRASHIVYENERVLDGVDILKNSRAISEFGQLMLDSHRSSRFDFGNSCYELDTLVESATNLPGFIGGRLQGGGFGGSTIYLVEADKVEIFQDLLLRSYFEKTGISTTSFVVSPGPGASCGKI